MAQKRKYDSKFKLDAVKYAQTHTGEATARHFNVDPKRIREWKKMVPELEALAGMEGEGTRYRVAGGGRKKVAGGGRKKVKVSEELETHLCGWILQQHSRHRRVSRKMIRTKAKEVFPHVGDVEGETSFKSNGSMDESLQMDGSIDQSLQMHGSMDQSVQSESRMRLQLAENLMRDARVLLHRLESQPSNPPPQPEPAVSQSSSSSSSSSSTTVVATQLITTSSSTPPSSSSTPAPPSCFSTQRKAPCISGPRDPSPTEFVEVLLEVRRVEERLCPFREKTQSILGAATSADYNNKPREREEDQRLLNMVGDALHLLGNTLMALGDIRCDLSTPPPRILHIVEDKESEPLQMNEISQQTMEAVVKTEMGDDDDEEYGADKINDQTVEPVVKTEMGDDDDDEKYGADKINHQTLKPVVKIEMGDDDEEYDAGKWMMAISDDEDGHRDGSTSSTFFTPLAPTTTSDSLTPTSTQKQRDSLTPTPTQKQRDSRTPAPKQK